MSIGAAASELGIAQVRVWELIRSGAVTTECIRGALYVEISELELYFEAHREKFNAWKQDYEHAQTCKLMFFN